MDNMDNCHLFLFNILYKREVMMQAGVQSYFAINQAQDAIAAKQHGNVLKSPFMAYGSFATYIHPNQRYGIIFGGNFKGMMMDIDQLMYQAVSKNNDSNELKGFIQSQGPRESANEHLVPEQLFDDPNTTEKEVEGVSAVKAIQIAQEQGQTVYTINQENYSQIIPKLSLSSGVMTDIRDNVAVGRTVTVHEKTINYKGWKGSGYIIIDPQTGSGAYLIDGGANGGYSFLVGTATGALGAWIAFNFTAIVSAFTLATPLVATLFVLVSIFTVISLISFMYMIYNNDKHWNCFMNGTFVGASAVSLWREVATESSLGSIFVNFFALEGGGWSSQSCIRGGI